MSGTARMSTRQTGQRKNKNAREADPKPRGKKSRKRGKGSKPVPKEGELGTLFDEVEGVEGSLRFLNTSQLKSCRSMSARGSSESSGTNYWEGKVIEYVVAQECDAIIDDLVIGKKGADQIKAAPLERRSRYCGVLHCGDSLAASRIPPQEFQLNQVQRSCAPMANFDAHTVDTAVPDSRFRDFEISGGRSHGGAENRRKQREETTTRHKQGQLACPVLLPVC
jgi:hypothetical protein